MVTSYIEAPATVPERRAEARWLGLYRAGGVAGLVIAAIIPVAMAAFIAWPPPLAGTAADWFGLFDTSPLLGLLGMDLLFMGVWALQLPIVLALYISLRRARESAMLLATTIALVATAVYFASNPAFEMLSVSQRYAAAGTEAEWAMYLAAGEAVLAGFQGTAFKVSYVLASLAGIIFALVILRSGVFSRQAGYARLLASVLDLGLFLPVVGVFLGLFSVLFEGAWYALIGRGLLRLARAASMEGA